MLNILKPYLLTFIPIFVAVDAIGNLPLFVSLVHGTTKKEKHRIILQTVFTATGVAVAFMFVGKLVLSLLGITIQDFQIAGGVLLFVIAARLLLPSSHARVLGSPDKEVGVVPLGTPLITGPAVLTTTLMMLDTYGVGATFVSLVTNMLFVWLCLSKADHIMKLMGVSGTRAFAKIMYILLAAIAAMMIRRGIMGVILR
ncbi:MAG: MarC family protein [Candidatus Omnitrophica bacterium]|nr:MarC family protein [Candidatus Omnitrophota bacterium]MBU1869413.1 MarC family protein [Candidatus Omnitrophota bacterium]